MPPHRTRPTPPPPPPTLPQLRALLRAVIATLRRDCPLRRRDRADLVALLRAALRYQPARE